MSWRARRGEATFPARDETRRSSDKKRNKTLHRRQSDECVSVIIRPADVADPVSATAPPQGTAAEEGSAAPLTKFITASNSTRRQRRRRRQLREGAARVYREDLCENDSSFRSVDYKQTLEDERERKEGEREGLAYEYPPRLALLEHPIVGGHTTGRSQGSITTLLGPVASLLASYSEDTCSSPRYDEH